MCVALPGKVIKLEGTRATVDFNGNRVQAEAGLVKAKPGDYVLVHAGCILPVSYTHLDVYKRQSLSLPAGFSSSAEISCWSSSP